MRDAQSCMRGKFETVFQRGCGSIGPIARRRRSDGVRLSVRVDDPVRVMMGPGAIEGHRDDRAVARVSVGRSTRMTG